MLRLIKSRRETELSNQSLGLFMWIYFKVIKIMQTKHQKKKNYQSSKIRISYTALPGFTNNLEV